MSPISIVETEYITLQYLADKGIIYHVIHQPIPDEPLKAALNAGTDALKQYGAVKWLSDDRKNGLLSNEFLDWSLNGWCPRTISTTGWKYWANVVPVEAAAAGSLIPVIEILQNMGLRMMVFTDVAEATEWLDSVKS